MNSFHLTTLFLYSTCHLASAAVFSTNINFNEAALPTSDTTVTGSNSYNVLDDITGAELTTLNGDLNDITITVATSAGTSNPNENFTITEDLDYSDFGLAPGTEISGLLITNILEDTRGVNNGTSRLSSAFIDFTFSGQTVPEPSSSALLALGSIFLLISRHRK